MSIKNQIKIIPRKLLEDERGSFLKVLRGDEAMLPAHTGEVYLVWAKPNASRGGHYHKVANEWFTLVEGRCRLSLSDPSTDERFDLTLDSATPTTVFVPATIAHCFYNDSSKQNFLLLAYSSEPYDSADTIAYNC